MKALKLERSVLFLFLPAFVVTFYIDVTNGPMFQPGTKSYFLIVLPIFLVVDSIVNNLIKEFIYNLTEGRYFVACPSCHFNNVRAVETCSACSYKKGLPLAISVAKFAPSFKGDNVPHGLTNLMNVGEREEILFHKKLGLFTQQLKNRERVAKKHFVITTANLIILDYFSFHIRMPKSWRERDMLPLAEIVTIEGKMKKFYTTMRPILIITTIHNDVYEIVFSTFCKYISEIEQIAAIIKDKNPQVEVDINLSETYWKEHLSSSSTWRMLLLILFLMMIVFYALWQSFPNLDDWGFK